MSRRGRVTVGVLVGVFLLFTLLGWGIDAYTDWLWFNEVDFTNVYTGVLMTRLALFVDQMLALMESGVRLRSRARVRYSRARLHDHLPVDDLPNLILRDL